MTTLVATKPIIRAKLNEVSKKRYRAGVLGVFAEARWNDGSLTHEGKPVSVVACPSVLAMWEALHSRSDDGWTVLLTPVDEGDLGSSILAHLVDGRLFTPNPWDALLSNFSATTIEPALYRVPNDRRFAEKLLAVLVDDSYTPAPGGVLTRDHVMSALSFSSLAITDSLATEIDGLAILEWSRRDDAQRRWSELAEAGAEISEPFSRWLGDRSAGLAGPVQALLSRSAIADLIPLGLIAELFTAGDTATSVGKGVFLGRYGMQGLHDSDLARWARQSSSLITSSMFAPNEQHSAIARAATIVSDLGIEVLASSSALLKQGLDVRIAKLCDALAAALPASHLDPQRPCVAPTQLAAVESTAGDMAAHFLARDNQSCSALNAATRLARWLAEPLIQSPGLDAAADRHLRDESWVDAALISARRGSDSPYVTATLRAVIDVVAALRRRSDRVFAGSLADSSQPTHLTVERVLPEIVIPLAKHVPTLLIVVDGLAISAANDVITDAAVDGWTEFGAQAGDPERQTALAALPTLTHRSRCSLLSADLVEGDATKERRNFVEILRVNHLQPPSGVRDPIFHKQALDSLTAGASLAADVSNAIFDTAKQPLVAAVLNYVDDTLHHTDPGGTDWTVATITHLRALLHAAKRAGRAVVITSDHGHVIDHGDGLKLTRSSTYGLRAHGDLAAADSDYEVVVQGPRVMTDNRKAVLAVDDRVRYGQRSAGYHGGATPAEVIVPVYAMVAGVVPQAYAAVGLVEPAWWAAPIPALPQPKIDARPKPRAKKPSNQDEPGLFDAPENPAVADSSSDLATRVVGSKVFASQMSVAGRIVVTKEQIRGLLESLVAAPAHELTNQQAASALAVPSARIIGALMQVKRVLDVEGYEVLEVRGGVVTLHEATLREQFGVVG